MLQKRSEIRRKLYSALSMLIICSILLVQSSYAWFTMSRAPEVVGADSQVSANGSLEVALLNTETYADLGKIRSGVGDSSALAGSVAANITWGNVIDLSDPSYGLGEIVVRPAVLDLEGRVVKDNILSTPDFGFDGRIDSLQQNIETRVRAEGGLFEDFGYGVRAIGAVYENPLTSKETITDTYGYAVDFAVRTSVENSHLLLQTDAMNRVYDGGAANTMGGGSYMQFHMADLSGENAIRLLESMRVAFVEPSPDGYLLLASAALDTEAVTDTTNKVPLRLVDDPDSTAVITSLERNHVKRVTAIVYMDGRFVQNASLGYSENLSMNATLNLQFSSDADLIPAENNVVRDGKAPGVETNLATEIASGTLGENENITWTLGMDGRLVISGSGTMLDFEQDSNEINDSWLKYRSDIRTVVVNEGVTHIGNRAFENCDRLIEVTLGADVRSIGDDVFNGCTSLLKVTIPEETTTFGAGCFENCTNLSTIYYSGTTQQWGEIVKGEDWDKGIEAYLVRCSDDIAGSNVVDSSETAASNPDTPVESGKEAVTWKLYENGTMILSGNGSMKAYENAEDAPWNESRTKVKHLVIDSGVTNVSKNSFAGCTELKSVSLADTVLTIDEQAFYACSNLNSIVIPDKVQSIGKSAFSGSGLTSIALSDNLKKIDDSAFTGCSQLTSVSIGYGIKSIGAEAFKDCTNLSTLIYNGTKLKWRFVSKGSDWDKNVGEYTLHCVDNFTVDAYGTAGSGVTWTLYDNSDDTDGLLCIDGTGEVSEATWKEYASQIRTVNIGAGIKGICADAFFDCTNLEKVNYAGTPEQWASIQFGNRFSNPGSIAQVISMAGEEITSLKFLDVQNEDGEPNEAAITKINDYAFYNFTCLTSVSFGNSITYIGKYAFYGCSNLSDISIPDNVTYIGESAFGNCGQLEDVKPTGNSETFNNVSNDGVLYSKDMKTLLWYSPKKAGDFEIPAGVETIAESAFEGCKNITGLTIPASVQSIEADAFKGCSNLKKVAYAGSMEDWLKLEFSNQYATPMKYATEITLNGQKVEGTVSIPDGVTAIPDFCFYGWDPINSIELPSSLMDIGTGALAACTNMNVIFLDPGNTSFYSYTRSQENEDGSVTLMYGGLLLSADQTRVIACAAAYDLKDEYSHKNAAVIEPFAFSGVRAIDNLTINADSIGEYAFENCKNLCFVEASEVTTIGDYAFDGCTDLDRVVLSDKLESIGSRSYGNCGGIYLDYYGSRTQWNAIRKANGWDSGSNPEVRTSSGDYGTFGDLIWKLSGNGTLTITGFGSMPATKSPWSEWDGINAVVIEDGVTSISSYAFDGCDSITSVTISDSVTSIGENAFYNCIFLQNLKLGKALLTIGKYAFYNCYNLKEVTIPENVYSIGEAAFYGCRSMDTLKLGDQLKTIDKDAFYGCSSLTNIDIPKSVTSIGNGAFGGCTSLTEIKVDETNDVYCDVAGVLYNKAKTILTAVPGSMTTYVIPDGVTSIGSKAFYGCSNMTNINIPESVDSIGFCAFGGCTSLTQIKVDENNKVYCDVNGVLFNKEQTILVAVPGSMTTYVIPDGVTSIGKAAFYGCIYLIDITIPKTVTSIESYAFDGCDGLKDVHYSGTEEQWAAIAVNPSNDSLSDATVHYGN